MLIRGDAGSECRTWLQAHLDDRVLILVACGPRYGLRQDSPEHRDYEEALDLLLARLRDMQAVVEFAVAKARRGPKALQGANNLKDGPIVMATETSISRLRCEILNLQDVATYPQPKRKGWVAEPVREHTEIYVFVPGYNSSNLDGLATELRKPSTRETDRDGCLDIARTSNVRTSPCGWHLS